MLLQMEGSIIQLILIKQEIHSSKIILAEIIMCFNIQEIGGTFIIKFFDLFNSITIKLLYIIYMHYHDIYLYKPLTSRPANSEKYIIAKKFKGIDKNLLNNLEDILEEWSDNEVPCDISGLNIDKSFYTIIEDYNKKFVDNQLLYINKTLNLIYHKLSKEEYKNVISKQVSNAVDWVNIHNLEINKNSRYYNKFICH